MADFRRWFYAFAVVAILIGLSLPASAQSQTQTTCNNTGSNIPTVRSEGYTELVGDLVLTCNNGTPTTAGTAVPQVNIQIFLNTQVSSKLTTSGGFMEALLIIDEPNSVINPARPILNCGGVNTFGAAPDSGPSLSGVCSTISTGVPTQTYDGCQAGTVVPATGLTSTCATGATAYGAGRPNVFQGRQALGFANGGQTNSVVFEGVPFDPPGTTTSRTLRFTNIRANANGIGVSTTLVQTFIYENVSISGNASVIVNGSVFYVAYVQRGLTGSVISSNLSFTQCNVTPYSGFSPGPYYSFNEGSLVQPAVRFSEGFPAAWKVKNVNMIETYGSVSTAGNYIFNSSSVGTAYPSDINQDVPGVSYFSESGFEDFTSANPSPNPPQGFGTFTVTGGGFLNNTASTNASVTSTSINSAGSASAGTRLQITFASLPSGATLWVPPLVYLYPQGTSTNTTLSTSQPGSTATGFMVLVSGTDAFGQGGSTVTVSSTYSSSKNTQVAVSTTTPIITYEVLFENPFGYEQADVPVTVSYIPNLPSNLPTPNLVTTAALNFAPNYQVSNSVITAEVQSSTYPIPRFFPDGSAAPLVEIVKCACDLLFPYVLNQAGYDTGIAIANTSLDPGGGVGNFGFLSPGPQSGSIEFWYYGVLASGGPTPGPQCTNTASPGSCAGVLTQVPGGQVLTYVLSTGSAQWGLDNRGAGFLGYLIAQTGFQYCHGFAFITAAQGPGAVNAGTSEGYLALVMDAGTFLPRTIQSTDNENN